MSRSESQELSAEEEVLITSIDHPLSPSATHDNSDGAEELISRNCSVTSTAEVVITKGVSMSKFETSAAIVNGLGEGKGEESEGEMEDSSPFSPNGDDSVRASSEPAVRKRAWAPGSPISWHRGRAISEQGAGSPLQRMIQSVKQSNFIPSWDWQTRVRRLPSVFTGDPGKWKRASNKKEVSLFIQRSHAESKFVAISHVISGLSLFAIFSAVILNESFYYCQWRDIRAEECDGLNLWKWIIIAVSFVHLILCLILFRLRCSPIMAESPMRAKSNSWIGLIFEILMCLIVIPPNIKLDFHSPFGGTSEVYAIENYGTALISARFFLVIRSIRELMRIKDGGMLFVARIIKVRTWSFGFNLKYAMHVSPVSSLLFGFMFSILWLSYLTRLAELPSDCLVAGVREVCAHEVVAPNLNHRHIRNTFWMVIVTVFTVGYGDMVPDTFFGRVFIGFVILLGNIWTSLLLGIVVEKIQLSNPEKQIVDLVEHKVWRKDLIYWASTWIQRWWRYHLASRRRNAHTHMFHGNSRFSGSRTSFASSWKRDQITVERGDSKKDNLHRAQSLKLASIERANTIKLVEASMTRLKRKFDPAIRSAHDKFTNLMSQHKSRPTVDTTLLEVKQSVGQIEEQMRTKLQQQSVDIQQIQSLLVQLVAKGEENQPIS